MASTWMASHRDDIDAEWHDEVLVIHPDEDPSALELRDAHDEQVGADGWDVVESHEIGRNLRVVLEDDGRGHEALVVFKRVDVN